jgi:hypothetical protein
MSLQESKRPSRSHHCSTCSASSRTTQLIHDWPRLRWRFMFATFGTAWTIECKCYWSTLSSVFKCTAMREFWYSGVAQVAGASKHYELLYSAQALSLSHTQASTKHSRASADSDTCTYKKKSSSCYLLDPLLFRTALSDVGLHTHTYTDARRKYIPKQCSSSANKHTDRVLVRYWCMGMGRSNGGG